MSIKKIGIIAGVLLLLALLSALIGAQIAAMTYNSQLNTYLKNQKQKYMVVAGSYREETESLNAAIAKVVNDSSILTFEEKVVAQRQVFTDHQSDMTSIAIADRKYVEQLVANRPNINEIYLFSLLNPVYRESVETNRLLSETLQTLQHDVAAEQFFVDHHEEYFTNLASMQPLIENEALEKFINVLSEVVPGDSSDEAKKADAIKEYSTLAKTTLPVLIDIVKSAPVPDDEYYTELRKQGVDKLLLSQHMFTLLLEADQNNNQKAADEADALAADNNGELLNYGKIAGESILPAYQDLAGLERDTKTLFALKL